MLTGAPRAGPGASHWVSGTPFIFVRSRTIGPIFCEDREISGFRAVPSPELPLEFGGAA